MAILLFKKLKNLNYEKHSEELFDKVEKTKLKNRTGIEEGAFIGFVDVFKNKDFIYLQAYKEYSTKGGYFDGDPKSLTPIKNTNGEYHSILITNSGEVLNEISRFFHNEDIRKLLIDLFKSLGLHNVSMTEVKKFDIKTMRTFYKAAKKVISLRIQEIGEVPPNPRMPPEDLEKAVQDMAEGSNEIMFNSGREKNLKQSQIVNEGLVRRSDIKEVRGVDEDGDTFTIYSNGRINSHLPEDSLKKANKLYKMIQKILGIFQ
ncbi:MAG: hypothetical protein KKD94_04645 [Nanoarchaeota archaeon]|nr:hypothetical protein [Nanoarchaeota archaeon]MBU1988739.1 hypothetical protein [Nanoarchaeota archaeon]